MSYSIKGIAPTLIMLRAGVRYFIQENTSTIAIQRGYVQSGLSTLVLDSTFSMLGASALTAPQTPLESYAQWQGDNQHEGGSDNV
jgi:hypothetical protein